MSSVGKSCGSMVKKLAGVATAYVSFRSVSSMLQESVENAKKAEEANTRLNTIMQQIPGITAEAKQATADYCKELSQQTTIGASAQKMGASQLASFQMSADSLNKLMPGLDKLAVAQYGVNVSSDQMIQAANLLGKAYSGQTGALSRAGIVMNETQAKLIKTGTETEKAAALVEILDQNFGDLAVQMANTNEGKIIQIKNAWESVKTEIGNALMPVVSYMVGYLRDHIPQIRDFITNAVDKAKPVLETALNAVKKGFQVVGDTVKWVADNLDWLAPIIGGVAGAFAAYQAVAAAVTAVQWALNVAMSANPIGIIVVAIGAAIGVLAILYNKCEGFRNFVNTAFGAIVGWAKAAWEGIKTSLAPLITAVKGAFSEAWETIKVVWNMFLPYFQAIWQGLQPIFTAVKTFIGGALSTAWEVIKGVWNTAVGFFTAIWNTIKGIFSVVKSVLTGDWQGAWDGIKGIVSSWGDFFSGVWESIKSIFSAGVDWVSGTFTTVKDAIVSALTGAGNVIKTVWDGIVGVVKGAINGIIKGINSMISGAVSGINKLIDGINAVTGAVGIPAIPTLTAPQIPLLANGGIIRRSGDVIVGERGPEMLRLPRGAQVTPLPAGAAAGGNTYQNTFYVEVNASDRGAAENFVKRVKEILDNM